jgi:hypothetical protein
MPPFVHQTTLWASLVRGAEEWRAQSVSVPDHVVVAYRALNAQLATMNTLLMTLLDRANA